MAVIRVNKTKDYTVMSNYHFREREMSLKAKGLLSLMLSLPPTWDYSIAGLVAICKEKESAIVSTLKELKKFGYLHIEKLMPNQTASGRIEYIYNVYEKPCLEKQGPVIQETEKQDLENLGLENQGQYIIKEVNTKGVNKKESITKERESKERFKIPTLTEIEKYCKERNNNIDAERFLDYYSSNGWMVGKSKMKDWKAAIRNWERLEKPNATEPKKEEIEIISKDPSDDRKKVIDEMFTSSLEDFRSMLGRSPNFDELKSLRAICEKSDAMIHKELMERIKNKHCQSVEDIEKSYNEAYSEWCKEEVEKYDL